MRRSLYLLVAILTFGMGTVLAILLSTNFLANKNPAPDSQQNVEAIPSVIAEESDEYAVYSAVISGTYGARSNQLIVIAGHAGYCKAGDTAFVASEEGQAPSGVPTALYNEYLSKNMQCMKLDARFDVNVRYTLIGDDEISELQTHNTRAVPDRFWVYFYKKFPNSVGLIYFSRVAFNSARDQALISVEYSCGGTCGEGDFVLLKKEQNIWKIQNKIGLWVS
ncbi:MAG: hypothetical protein AUG51_22965 [Acidobacteria bacterium 13_1_20CM_3_53_8]|nr:MAG: hypothetical protein AUG51_22965 [Acidobacteria bacterium 13_1_20CM_3_53_8]